MLGWRIIHVSGRSMDPIIASGSYALFRRHPKYSIGDIILADHPKYGRIVKRISKLEAKGVRLTGQHPDSVTTEAMGLVPADKILGKLIWKVSPPKANIATDQKEVY